MALLRPLTKQVRRVLAGPLADSVAFRLRMRATLRDRLFWLLLLLWGGLVVPGLLWELPYDAYHAHFAVDEQKLIGAALSFPRDIVQREDLRYPTLVHYLVGLEAFVLKGIAGVAALFGLEPQRWTHELALATAIVGRLTVLGFGAASLLLLWTALWHGSGSRGLALALTAAVAFAPAMVEQSTVLLTNVPAAFFFLTVALVSCKLAQVSAAQIRRWTLLGAVLLALGVGAKYSVGPAILMVVLGYLLNQQRGPLDWGASLRLLGRCVLLGLLVFTLTTPSWLIHPAALIQSLRYEQERVAAVTPTIGAFFADSAVPLAFALDLLRSLGPPLVLLCGLCVFWRRQPAQPASLASGRMVAIVLSGLLGYLLLNTTALRGRYVVIILPTVGLLVGIVLARRWQYADAIRPALIVCGLSAICGYAAVLPHYLVDPRVDAAHWLAQQTAPADRIALIETIHEWALPPVVGRQQVARSQPHDLLVLSSVPVLADTANVGPVLLEQYSYRDVMALLQQNGSQSCAQQGPRTWAGAQQAPLMLGRQPAVWYQNSWPSAEICTLYAGLPTMVGQQQGCYRLEAIFDAAPLVRRVTRPAAPEIRIFRFHCAS